ncbi:MAG: hypothetical protein ABI767_08715 [Rhodanobacter sp.]
MAKTSLMDDIDRLPGAYLTACDAPQGMLKGTYHRTTAGGL